MRARLFFLTGSIAFVFLFLGYSVYSLQLASGDKYARRARAQHLVTDDLRPERGNIYFSDQKGGKIPAAINKDYQIIYAVPSEVEDVSETTNRILSVLELDPTELIDSLNKKRDQYEELKVRASESEVSLIQESEIPGVYVKTVRNRFYPFEDVGSHVLGFVGINEEEDRPIGLYGIESQYNGVLAGKDGYFNEKNQVVSGLTGKDITLTIDHNLQMQAENILRNLVSKYEAKSGTVIIQDPNDGKILAMGSFPTFNPNSYADESLRDFINTSVQSRYEPGSVFKVLTMAAGIDSGAITPETTYTDYGFLTIDRRKIQNWDLKAHGELTMTEVIEGSINTGTVFAEEQMGHETFYDYLVKFGFKELTGVDLPNETIGSLKPLEEEKRDINFATASYGQGVSVTPLQMITAVSAIANGGLIHQPYITTESHSFQSRRVISKETANQVRDMMISAVDKAWLAKIPHYSVAGKTGTANTPDFNKGGYTDEVINTYVGFAPASNPQFTILIRLDEPQTARLAGRTVVPAFRELAGFVLNYKNIAPDRE